MGLASDHGARAENLEEVVPRLRDAVDRETGDRLVSQLSLWAAVDEIGGVFGAVTLPTRPIIVLVYERKTGWDAHEHVELYI